MFNLIQVGKKTFYFDMPSRVGVYKTGENTVCLIDSGNDRKIGERIVKILQDKNLKIQAIFNTHCHADHTGGNAAIEKATGCKIYCPDYDCSAVSFPTLNPLMLWGAYPIKELDNKFYLAENSMASPLSSATLPKGLEAINLKGHTLGMVGYKTDDDVYFLADSVVSKEAIESYKVTYIVSPKDYLKTLEFLETLNGKVYVPSHTPHIESIKELVEVNRQGVYNVISDLLEFCKTPRLTDDIVAYIFSSNSIRFTVLQYALVGSAVKSYLSYLEREKKIAIVCNSDKIYWKTVI